jgi:hypothetical protein
MLQPLQLQAIHEPLNESDVAMRLKKVQDAELKRLADQS